MDEAAPRPLERRWNAIFNDFVELDNELPTHFWQEEGSPPKLSQIDRAFLASPSWLAIQWHVALSTRDLPERLREIGLSDHAPIV
eukprot:1200128-Pyramimonas_sp.AAC.1